MKKGMDHWDGRVFYSVFNLLFLEGYKPRTFCYEQNAEEDMVPDKLLSQRDAGYVKKDGIGFILWDVNEKRTHKMSY